MTLCLECHGPDANPQKVEGQHLVTIFDGKVKLPENYFRKVPILPLKYGFGHPVEHHPVSDVPDPKDQGRDQAELPELPSAARFGESRAPGEGPGSRTWRSARPAMRKGRCNCVRWRLRKMLKIRSNWRIAEKSWVILALVLAVLLSAVPSQAQKKSNKNKATGGLRACTEESGV